MRFEQCLICDVRYEMCDMNMVVSIERRALKRQTEN